MVIWECLFDILEAQFMHFAWEKGAQFMRFDWEKRAKFVCALPGKKGIIYALYLGKGAKFMSFV